MSRLISAFAILFGLVAALASAQTPPTTPPSNANVQAPAQVAPATPTPVPVTPAEEGISAKAKNLADMDQDLALALKKLQLGTTQAQQNDVDRKLGSVVTGINTVPELVGLSGVGNKLVAEFLTNNAIVRVRAGDWVTSDWRVDDVTPNGVSLARRGSKQHEQILFGHRPMSTQEIANDLANIRGSIDGRADVQSSVSSTSTFTPPPGGTLTVPTGAPVPVSASK